MSGFGPPPGAAVAEAPRRPPAYLPPGGLKTLDSGMPSAEPAPTPPIAPGGLAVPGAAESEPVASAYRGGSVVRGPQHTLLVNSHRPGIVSLRPMSLGDIVDGAVKHIRRNPGPVFGFTIVLLLAGIVPAIFAASLSARGSWFGDVGANGVVDRSSFFTLVLLFGVGFASVVLSGAMSYSVGEAVLGRRPTVPEMWRAVRRRLLRLIGLSALLTVGVALPLLVWVLFIALASQGRSLLAAVLVAVIGGLFVLVWSAVLLTKTSLAGVAVVLERRGVFDALQRSWTLTNRVFWRTLVRLAVVGLLSVVVFWVVQLPLLVASSLVGAIIQLSPSLEALISSLGVSVATLLSTTVVVPFVAGATALVYVDQRMRLEGFDLVLQRAARATSGNGS